MKTIYANQESIRKEMLLARIRRNRKAQKRTSMIPTNHKKEKIRLTISIIGLALILSAAILHYYEII